MNKFVSVIVGIILVLGLIYGIASCIEINTVLDWINAQLHSLSRDVIFQGI